MTLRDAHETVRRGDGGRRLRLAERLERHAAGEAVGVAGRHVVLIDGLLGGLLRDEARLRVEPLAQGDAGEREVFVGLPRRPAAASGQLRPRRPTWIRFASASASTRNGRSPACIRANSSGV